MEVPYLQIEPTTRCNFTCGFCVGRHFVQRDMDILAFSNALKAIKNLKHISMQGEGEPLLHPQFFDMIQIVKTEHPKSKVSFICNGSLLNKKKIKQILTLGVDRIMVSIESPDKDEFREIRGGKLSKVISGIKSLLQARTEYSLNTPIVGFAVTVMKRTIHKYRGILKIYNELGMDGGLIIQFLQDMEIYTKYYNEEMMRQLLSIEEMQKYASISEYDLDVRELMRNSRTASMFYNELNNHNKSGGCPWLANALYVNIDGISTGCVYMKDSHRDGFGVLTKDSVKDILAVRDDLQKQLLSGRIPKVCSGCAIANGIQMRVISNAKSLDT